MLVRSGVVLLSAVLSFSGCTGPGPALDGGPGDACLFGGPPGAAREGRTAFHLRRAHLDTFPPLEAVFETEGHLVPLPCQDGNEVLTGLAAEGADVRFSDEAYGDDAYLTWQDVTLHVAVQLVV